MIHRFLSCFRTRREGQTLAVVAVMMVGLLAIMGFGIDLGMAYTARAEAQRVADASALAGASAFLDFQNHLDPAAAVEAEDRARDYASKNMVRNRMVDPDPPEVKVQVIPAEQTVRVRIERTRLPIWFARWLDQTELTVSAIAAAHAVNAGSSDCVKPFAIPDRWEEKSNDPLEDFNENNEMNFDNQIPCNGQHCDGNEVWTFEDGVDVYRPLNQMGSTPAWPDAGSATSWGSEWVDPVGRDAGARILITPQSAQGTGTPGWYQYWKMPGTSGANDLTEAIKGCIDLQTLGVGSGVEADPQTGNIGNPVYKAFEHLWDPAKGGDGDIQWDSENNVPHYPNDPGRSIFNSPRVFTVLLVHPADISSGGSHTMRIADLATVFLEDPRDIYGDQGNQNFKLPITGRLFYYGSGSEGPNSGQLQKFLRLIE